jgi:hypothetical protein
VQGLFRIHISFLSSLDCISLTSKHRCSSSRCHIEWNSLKGRHWSLAAVFHGYDPMLERHLTTRFSGPEIPSQEVSFSGESRPPESLYDRWTDEKSEGRRAEDIHALRRVNSGCADDSQDYRSARRGKIPIDVFRLTAVGGKSHRRYVLSSEPLAGPTLCFDMHSSIQWLQVE